jgi:hypothetical protein
MHVKAKVAEEEPLGTERNGRLQLQVFHGYTPRTPWSHALDGRCAITSQTSEASSSLSLLFTYKPLELCMSSSSHVSYVLTAMTVP